MYEMIFSHAPTKASPCPRNVRDRCVYSPPGNCPSGVERNTEYATDVASTIGASTTYARITLGPVNPHAPLVTLKMPAPMRMPINTAYDSSVPRSRRRVDMGER